MPTMALATANTILNRVAAEVGMRPVADAFAAAAQDDAFLQLTHLLNVAGEELLIAHPWAALTRGHTIVTQAGDTGDYPLPPDFAYMIDQTGWERAGRQQLYGPLSAQEWAYVSSVDHAAPALRVAFRFQEGNIRIHPQPPAADLELHFEYVSKNWVMFLESAVPSYKDEATDPSDTPLYDKTLLARYVKLKFLTAKGFDTTKAQDDFNQMFSFLTGKDTGAKILSLTGGSGFPYLGHHNLPDTGYGNP